jgi:glycosyltransferase involved in cell wall biosynthesis
VGFDVVSGAYVTQLDADDELTSNRFETLMPLAKTYGAAADNLLMLEDETGATLGTVMGDITGVAMLDLAAFMKLNAPLVPLIWRDHVLKREPGIEFSEDVVANFQLIDRIGKLPVTASSSYLYRIHNRSMANISGASERFERGYSAYIERLEGGDGFGLKVANRRVAADGLIAKRSLNRAFMDAQKVEPGLGFQAFVGRM